VLGKKMDFRAYGIDLEFKDDALRILASRAYHEKTGARGLLSVFEKTLIKFEKTLPSTDVKKLVVDKAMVDDPSEVLKKLLLNDNIKGFQKNFLLEHGIYLDFEKEALEQIQEKARNEGKSIRQVCQDLFHDYPYALQLMNQDNFTIPAEAVVKPQEFIDEYVRKNYKSDQS